MNEQQNQEMNLLQQHFAEVKSMLADLEPHLVKIENIKDNGAKIAAALQKIDTKEIDKKLQDLLETKFKQLNDKINNTALVMDEGLDALKIATKKDKARGYKAAIWSLILLAGVGTAAGYFYQSERVNALNSVLATTKAELKAAKTQKIKGEALIQKYNIPLEIWENAGTAFVVVKGKNQTGFDKQSGVTYIQAPQ